MADIGHEQPTVETAPRSWLKSLLALGGAAVVIGGTLGWLGWRELQKRLPALISDELSGALDRPIKLGELQRFGVTGLRFGETILPPTTDDFTWARVEATDISFNPFDILLRRTFRPSLLLLHPEVSIKQRFDRTWVLETPDSADNEGKLRTEIGQIRIRNALVNIGPVSRQEIVAVPEGFSSAQIIVLSNVNLSVRFSGEANEQVSLNLGGRLKNGTFRIKGAGNLDSGNTNLTLLGKKLRIDTINPFLGGSLFLGEGYGYANLFIEIRPEQNPPVSLKGAARLQNGEAAVTGLPSRFEEIYGRLLFRRQRVTFDGADLRFGPILAAINGSVSWQDGYRVGVTVPDVSVAQLETAFAQSLPVSAAGRLTLKTNVRGPIKQPRFEGQLTNLSPILVDRLPIDQINAQFSGTSEAASLDDFWVRPATGGSITATGVVDFDESLLKLQGVLPTALNLTANVDLPLDPIAGLYGANFPVAFGRLTAIANVTGPLLAPTAIANWQLTEGIAVGSGRVDYTDGVAAITNTQLTVADSGAVTAAGQADLRAGMLNLNADARLPLDEIAAKSAIAVPAGLTLGILTAQASTAGPILNPVAIADWQLQGGSIPGQGQLTYADQIAAIRDTIFRVGDGTLNAVGQADFRAGFWDVGVTGSDIDLAQVSPELLGRAGLSARASGSLTDLSPAGVRASGNVYVSDGVPLRTAGINTLLDGPLALEFDWDGSILGIPTLTAPGLDVSGQIATAPHPNTGLPVPTDTNLDVRLTDYDVARLNIFSPVQEYGLLVAGRVDFDGTLRGGLDDPTLIGDLALRQAALGNFALLSDVSGTADASRRGGGHLDLQGEMTTIQATVDRELLPVSLLFRNGAVLAQADREGDWLRGRVRDFPLTALGIRPVPEPDLGFLGGTLESDFEVKLSTLRTDPTADATFAIARPALGPFTAIALQGGLRVADGMARLNNTFLTLPNSRFDLAAAANLRSPFAAEARVVTTDARIEDILAALRIAELADLQDFLGPRPTGTAADLDTVPIETDPSDMAGQIQQAIAAAALRDEQIAADANTLLPPLSDLAGVFAADISLAVSEVDGVAMAFDVGGRDWVWGPYDFANQFAAKGALQDEVLTLESVRLESGAAYANLTGQLAADGLDTQLEMANFDLAPIAQWLDLPLPLQGEVNAVAELTGAVGNPTLQGAIAVENAALSDYPLLINSDFSYRDAWFRFNAQVQGEPDEPLLVQGQVPYALPFMTVQPDSNNMLVQASLGSGGFALIDVFSPYVAWGGGDASLLIEAKGPVMQPEVLGQITFADASITSDYLQQSLTDLNGTVGFVGDRIQVTGLQGTLLDGQFFVVGELPFLTTTAQTAPPVQPLTLNLNTLAFNFEDEIASNIDGDVVVSNSLQSPTIGGLIDLSNIRVDVGSETFRAVNSLLTDPGIEEIVARFEQRRSTLERVPGQFDNFTIRLPDVAEVSVYPLLSLAAVGEVSLSGPLSQPTGDGYVELLDGWVNTVTTNLFLVTTDRRNLITLDPALGFNPYFDLVFQGDLPLQRQYDVSGISDYALGNTSEIPDLDPLASVTLFDEILIQAILEGHVTESMELLTLTSTPPYSEQRLLSMLSGGYLADLPEGEPALATGANLLFALFAEQQDALGDAIGVRRLRFNASTILPGDDTDVFGIGVGVNVGITDAFSAELVQVLNRNQPYQLNLQYRLNNNFGFGSSTDFSDESRVFMQYRVDF